MRTSLASETRRMCLKHRDRPATHVRIEKRTKPIPQTVRKPQCDECATAKPARDPGVTDATVRRL